VSVAAAIVSAALRRILLRTVSPREATVAVEVLPPAPGKRCVPVSVSRLPASTSCGYLTGMET